MEQPKTVLIDVDVLNQVVQYMAGKPYVEVAELITRVQKSVADNRKPISTSPDVQENE